MNTRLSQDAADALEGYEQRQAWRNRILADRARAMQPPPTKAWAPVLSEQERMEREQQIEAGLLPF